MGIFSRLFGGQRTGSGPTQGSPASAAGGRDQPRFAVLDVETTGLNADRHRIIEIAVVTTDPWGRVLDQWTTRVNPQGPVGATHIHGITAEDVAGAPVFADVVDALNGRLRGAAMAAHHARFDVAFLRAEYARAGWSLPHVPALCTLAASEVHLPSLERRRLADCCTAIGHPLEGAHSALGDALGTAALLAAYMDPRRGVTPLQEHVDLPRAALMVAWPSHPSSVLRSPHVSSTPSAGYQSRTRVVTPSTAPPAPLVQLVAHFSLVDALDEGAPIGSLAYLEKLAVVLEDGLLTEDEISDLESVAVAEGLTPRDTAAAHHAFVLALAHEALRDGLVSRSERAELHAVAALLEVPKASVTKVLDVAERSRNLRLSTGLRPLPSDWPHGEPLRVGDKVAFTGCDDGVRAGLEARSEQLGVRIMSNVSTKTAMLVSDGTFEGTKAVKAQALGTRIVDPTAYAVLLDHLQPALA